MFGNISLVSRTSTTLPYSGSGIKLNLMEHSIRCDLSIARHEFKICKICERFQPKKLSSSIDIYIDFKENCCENLKEIKVICFVESSKKRTWNKNRTSEWATVE